MNHDFFAMNMFVRTYHVLLNMPKIQILKFEISSQVQYCAVMIHNPSPLLKTLL